MPLPHLRLGAVATVLVVLALVAGTAAVAAARWMSPMIEAEQAVIRDDVPAALLAYAQAEARFARFQLLGYLFAAPHAAAIQNQLALLYRSGDLDAVIEKAAAAPAAAAPRFWAGTALLTRALNEEDPQARMLRAVAAEAELGQALRYDPDDWNTRYNYELAARLLTGLRREPAAGKERLLRLLRPQPAEKQAPRRVG
jgi:hypothetical protein